MVRVAPLIYIAICIICPLTYSWKMEFVFWGNEFSWDWFARDLTYTIGLICSPCVALEKESATRKKVALCFIGEGGFQLLSLLKDNNNFDLTTTVLQSIFLFICIVFIYKKEISERITNLYYSLLRPS